MFYQFLEEDFGWIYLAIVIAAIIIIFSCVTIFRHLSRRNRNNKSIKELEKKFETSYALLIGQDTVHLKRIYTISTCNLLYAEIYTNYMKEYDSLMHAKYDQSINALNILKESMTMKTDKNIKENIKKNKEILEEYIANVSTFSEQLHSTLKREEDAVAKSLQQKEDLRIIKTIYFDNKQALRLVEDSFELLFSNIDEAFKRYEEVIDSANYEQVDEILTRIDFALKELKPVLEKLPLLCAKVVNVVPDKIDSLKNRYEELRSEGYALSHLHIKDTILEYEDIISNITNRLKAFELDGCNEELDKIILNIDAIFTKFDEEINAKERFESCVDSVYKEVSELDNKFIKICNYVPEIKKVFVIQDKYLQDIDVIHYNITQLDTIKRTLDNYIHSTIKQPYSLLDKKCSELQEASKIISIKLNELSTYLLSLETDYDTATNFINESYFAFKDARQKVHELYVNTFEIQFEDSLQKGYELIDQIYQYLQEKPCNIQIVNNLIISLGTFKEDMLKKLEENLNFALITESLVVYANKDRYHLSDIRVLLSQIETSFFDGEFERAYLDVGNITKKLKNATKVEN